MLTGPPCCTFHALVPRKLKNIEVTNWICLVPPALNLDVTWARIICLLPQTILASCPWSHSLRSYRWWLCCSQWVVKPSISTQVTTCIKWCQMSAQFQKGTLLLCHPLLYPIQILIVHHLYIQMTVKFWYVILHDQVPVSDICY